MKKKIWIDPKRDIWPDRVWLPLSEMTEAERVAFFRRMAPKAA